MNNSFEIMQEKRKILEKINEVPLEKSIEITNDIIDQDDFPMNDLKIYQKSFKTILKIQSYWRMKKAVKLFKIRQRKQKHRYFVLKELLKTEEDYVNSLNLIIKNVMKAQEEKGLLTVDESKKIFSCIENIMLFNKQIYEILERKMKTYTPHSLIADEFIKMLDYFKVYNFYCNGFEESRKCLSEMKTVRHKFLQWVGPLEFTPALNNLDFASLLVKPVQRLPKYVLLFKDLLKNTEIDHKDYGNIKQVLEKFKLINEENNLKMEKFLKNLKLFELDQTYKATLSIPIIEPNREFLMEEALSIILDDIPKPVIVYFLSDMLLVAEVYQDQNRIIKYLHFDENSFIRDKSDTKYFKHVFSIYGKEGGIPFCTENGEEIKRKVMQFIEQNILENLKKKANVRIQAIGQSDIFLVPMKKSSSPIIAKILGTSERGFHGFRPYTIYIIEIIYENVKNRLFLRYSELLKLEALLKSDYSDVHVPVFGKKTWISSHKTKVIESRKILIENFLQSVLQHEKVKENSSKVLDLLGLPKSFYENSSADVRKFSKGDEILKQFGRFSVYSALKQNSKIWNRITCESYQGPNTQINNSDIQITKVDESFPVILANGSMVKINIHRYTTAFDACRDIAESLGLKSSLDFKLFLVNEGGDERILDDDEFLYKILNIAFNLSNENIENGTNQQSFFRKIKNKVKNLITYFEDKVLQVFHLQYRKYLFLPDEIERRDYLMDEKKIFYITAQLLDETFRAKFIVNLSEFTLLCSLNIYINKGHYDANTKILNLLVTFVAKNRLSIKPDEYWEEKIGDQWKKLSADIEEVVEKQTSQQEEVKENNEGHDHMEKNYLTNKLLVAHQIVLKVLKRNKLYGVRTFWGSVYKNYKKYNNNVVDPIVEQFPDFVWLGIQFDKVMILSPQDKSPLKSNDIMSINNLECYPTSLVMQFEDFHLRFDSKNSFEIYQLINQYKEISSLLPKLEKGEGLTF